MVLKNSLAKITPLLFFIGFIGVIMDARSQTDTLLPEVEYIEPNTEKGFSMATKVKDVPLAFTDQLFPFDEKGNLVGAGDLLKQVDQLVKNAESVLLAGGSNLKGLVRIHLYLNEEMNAQEVSKRIKDLLPEGIHPSLTLVKGKQAREGVLVSMDAVAVAQDNHATERVIHHRTYNGFENENRSQVAVLAPGRKVFISGQAEKGKNIIEANQKTMQNLFATLAYVGAGAGDIVQVKAFLHPIEKAKKVEESIATYFKDENVPPIIVVEWVQDSDRIEIELVASAPAVNPPDNSTVHYYAPPWMTQATTFSRIVDIHSGGLFFTSGLYGENGINEEERTRNLFETLSLILKSCGSDFNQLIKATYYPVNETGRLGLVNVRPDFYNPEKPPAASLIQVRGVAFSEKNLTVDFIGKASE